MVSSTLDRGNCGATGVRIRLNGFSKLVFALHAEICLFPAAPERGIERYKCHLFVGGL
jgi:hypothetical protein